MLTGLSLSQGLAGAVGRAWLGRCQGVISLALVPLFAALLLVSRADAVGVSPGASTTVFLADPKLGVVGAIKSGDAVMYFEAVAPAGSNTMSARLLDVAGRTIAIAGHSMDSEWVADTSYDAAAAAKSLSIAAMLPGGLASALDQSVFGREAARLSALAGAASRSTPGTAALRDDSISGDSISGDSISGDSAKGHSIAGDSISGDSISGDSIGSSALAYDRADAARVTAGRDSIGNLTANYLGTSVSTFNSSVAGGMNGNRTTGSSGISVEIENASGAAVAYLVGGDDVRNAWYANVFAGNPTAVTDPIQYYEALGTAVRGALLIGRYSPIATAGEADAITRLAADLRGRLLPTPGAAASTAPAIFKSKSRGMASTEF